MPRPLPQLVVRPHDPRRTLVVTALIVVAWGVSLYLAWTWGAQPAAPDAPELRERATRAESRLQRRESELAAARTRLSTVERADQVSRTANEALQRTLRDREEEIAALRADLAFYQRLVGGRSQRQGLTVHALTLDPIGQSRGVRFELTLVQNLKKAATTEGQAEILVDGVREGKLATLGWRDLVQAPDAEPLAFSFRYFQQLSGNLILPDGFTPSRIRVVVKSSGGERTEQGFAWDEALAAGENDDVRE
jgi:hypothetical protein